MRVIQGELKTKGKKIAVVVSRFNDFITKRLLDGCVDELKKIGVADANITVVWVPGAFEIPVIAAKLAAQSYQAVICLGCVIKGQTDHYELVMKGATDGIMAASLKSGKPVIFEVLACETVELANQRSKVKGDNKGRDAAQVAIEMIDVLSQVKSKKTK